MPIRFGYFRLTVPSRRRLHIGWLLKKGFTPIHSKQSNRTTSFKGLLNLSVFIGLWWRCCMFVCSSWKNKCARQRWVICLTLCDLDSLLILLLFLFFTPLSRSSIISFSPPCSSALSALIMLDINEPALKMGEEMVLAGYKCALWPLPVAGCGLAPLRWGAVVAARLSSTSRKSTSRSSGVIPFQVALPKAPAPPAVVPHLSRLMRTQAWRSPVRCCSH